jgi:hypothetical protein
LKTKTHPKKQSKENPTIPIAKQRSEHSPISVIGHFKSIDSEFTITASPEAWLKLQKKCFDSPDTYQYMRKGLFKDLWPFIYTAHEKAQHWTPKSGQQIFRNALYVQAAIIHDLLREQYRQRSKKTYDKDLWRLSFKKFKSVWKEDAAYLKLNMINEKIDDYEDDKISTLEQRFYTQYINKGRNLLSGDRKQLKEMLSTLISFLIGKKEWNWPGYKNNRSFQQVYDMTIAVEALISGRGEDQFISNIVGVKTLLNPEYKGIARYIRLARQAFPSLT